MLMFDFAECLPSACRVLAFTSGHAATPCPGILDTALQVDMLLPLALVYWILDTVFFSIVTVLVI